VFESIQTPGRLLLLASWRDAAAAVRWSPRRPEAAAGLRQRCVRIIRDCGLADRREAPQFHPEVAPAG
ncbi:MAG: antibiotic biosynthesis monooxygenase, partial [Rhodospirillaceae bacterium]|nr:antibiotic biosynthesis monooxygenase [Rhodospirillaceae bacterium]